MFKWIDKQTVNFRFVITVLLSCVSLAFLSGVVFFGQSVIRTDVKQSTNNLKQNSDMIFQSRLILDRLDSTFKIIIAARGKNVMDQMVALPEFEKKFVLKIDEVIEFNAGNIKLVEDLNQIKTNLSKMVARGKATTVAFLSGEDDKALNMAKGLAGDKKSLQNRLGLVVEDMRVASSESLFLHLDQVEYGLALFALFFLSGMLVTGNILARSTRTQLAKISNNMEDSSRTNIKSAENLSGLLGSVEGHIGRQVSAIQETMATLTQISAMVTKSSEFAQRSSDRAQSSERVVEEGQKAVEETIHSMEEIAKNNDLISEHIKASNDKIHGIIDVINEISTKTQVINDIVFQTKLLAFNASVEAARAGEHGKGFSVVAEEVGNLANLSGTAAKEIGDMLLESTSSVEEIINEANSTTTKLMDSAKHKVDSGMQVARRCGEVFNEVVGDVNEVRSMMGEISHSSQEQAEGVGNITEAMTDIDRAIQETAQAVTDSNSAVDDIFSQAKNIDQHAVVLNLLVKKPDKAVNKAA